jgi:hypothetical protein
MMEYMFFDARLRDSFVAYCNTLGVICELLDDNMGLVAAVPEDLADDVVEALESCYDELEKQQADLMTQAEGGLKRLAGFQLVLPDGRTCMVPLQTEIANRLFSCFTFDEIQSLFGTVAGCALNPENEPLCKMLNACAE